jgi:hypothetical protein
VNVRVIDGLARCRSTVHAYIEGFCFKTLSQLGPHGSHEIEARLVFLGSQIEDRRDMAFRYDESMPSRNWIAVERREGMRVRSKNLTLNLAKGASHSQSVSMKAWSINELQAPAHPP